MEISFTKGTRVEAKVSVTEYFVEVGVRGVVVGPHPTKREKLKILCDDEEEALTAYVDGLRKVSEDDGVGVGETPGAGKTAQTSSAALRESRAKVHHRDRLRRPGGHDLGRGR